MRVTTGRLRGRRILVPPGREVRPTTDHARRAIFDILARDRPRLVGARFLDVFAGSGAVGLEAWSRGAARVVLMENGRTALAALRHNLRDLPREAAIELRVADATRPGPAPHPFDIVFLDPPYRSGLAVPALEALAAGGWLAPEARVVVELAKTEDLPELAGFAVEDIRRYGAAKFVFLRRLTPARPAVPEGGRVAPGVDATSG